MHLIVLLTVVVVLAFDSGAQPFGADGIVGRPALGAALALALPPLTLVVAAFAARPHRDGRHRAAAFRRCDRILRFGPWIALAVHAIATFAFGWVTAVRRVVGDVVLLDEAIAVAPPLLAIVAAWIGTWPVERRVREWTMLQRLDETPRHPSVEPPVESSPTVPSSAVEFKRPRLAPYLGHQIRAQLLLVLIPILVAIGVSEWGRRAVGAWRPSWSEAAQPWISLGAVGVALLATPLLVRWALALRTLPPGELRDDLIAVCTAHRVRIRDILVWRTGNSMLNGAVLGLFGPLRHVLLTDGLLRTLPRPMLVAVMAHEVGHIRRRHLPWLAASALASLWLASVVTWAIGWSVESAIARPLLGADRAAVMTYREWTTAVEVGAGLLLALVLIGWASRRLEWQADAFAAVHLDEHGASPAPGVGLDALSVETVCAALETVTVASGGEPSAKSWRHGSIRHRQRLLRAAIGRPRHDLPIDRKVRRMKVGVAAIVMLALASLLLPATSTAFDDLPMTTTNPPTPMADTGVRTASARTTDLRGLPFVKMHGIGNDYVYVDTFAHDVDDPAALSVAVSDRHRGIGGDGLILIGPPSPGVDAAVRMRMFNADGSESEMCGNGVRCVAKFAVDRGLGAARPLRVETGRGVLEIDWRRGGDGVVVEATVDMGPPILDAPSIPFDPTRASEAGDRRWSIRVDGTEIVFTPVSMGNPHAVSFVDALPDPVALRRLGPLVERHPAFPARVNMHWVRCETGEVGAVGACREVTMVTWERGSGPTLACGTGASAVCVAGALLGRTARSIVAHLPGGDLRLEWRETDGHVLMTGPAEESFAGIWPLSKGPPRGDRTKDVPT